MTFSELSLYLDQLEATSSRNELVRILAEAYKACSVDEIEPITYLIQGRLAPFFEPVEIGLGERLLMSAMATAYRTSKEDVTKTYKQTGDLGLTAMSLGPKTRDDTPVVVEVHQRLWEIAGLSGEGSVKAKLDLFAALLGELDAASAKHLVRITLGKMRLGIGDPTVLDALSFARLPSPDPQGRRRGQHFLAESRNDDAHVPGARRGDCKAPSEERHPRRRGDRVQP